MRLCGKMLMNDGLAIGVIAHRDPERLGIEVGRRADQHRGHADQAVERRDQLRHRRHLDLARGDQADAAADQRSRREFRRTSSNRDAKTDAIASKLPAIAAVSGQVRDQRRHDRDRHADHAGAIAAAAALRARQAPQREDEADAGDQISEQHPGGLCVRRLMPSLRSRFLYIASIRAVTAKPPKMFTLASATATSPSHFERGTARRRRGDQRADHDHRGNGVGDAHQRRVQRRGHRPHDIIADEAGQHENRQDRNEVHQASSIVAIDNVREGSQ